MVMQKCSPELCGWGLVLTIDEAAPHRVVTACSDDARAEGHPARAEARERPAYVLAELCPR